MPAYISSAQATQVRALYPGNSIALVNNASTDSGITSTIQFAVGPVPGGNPRISFVNTTNQTATLNAAASDASANYEPIAGGTVSSGQTQILNLQGGWINASFSTAPTSGSLIAVA
jgi:hypothetical protein